jgi:hypothetical protein
VPLWRGAELYASYIERLSNSDNFEPGFAFNAFRYRNGLKVAAVQQTFWLGRHVHANVGVGRYNYDAWGVQGEATVFVPGRDDVIRLRGGVYERQPGQNRRQTVPASATYRWVPSPNTWVEAGVQQYSDGFRGPSVVLTRWFGDVGVHLFYRRSGDAQFAGLELSVPLTPRQGMAPGLVQVGGTSHFTQGVRTRLVDSSTGVNFIQPTAALDMQLNYNAEHAPAQQRPQQPNLLCEAAAPHARGFLPVWPPAAAAVTVGAGSTSPSFVSNRVFTSGVRIL